jgi:sensor histidine kinase YesM
VLWLRRRVPLSRGRWAGGVSLHLALSLLAMAAYYLVRIYHLMWSWRENMSMFWVEAGKNFWGHNIIDMVYYWAVLGCGYGFEFYQKYKHEELKAAQLGTRLVEAELTALKHQLQPHFLFNTMNTIAVLVREGRNGEAVTLLAQLGALLRMSLDGARAREVTLRQELEFLERYLDIQRARFSDRLGVRLEVSPEALEARIPNLLLQPVVENAVLHGIAPKHGPGVLEISAAVSAGSLHLEVRDDGVGFAAGGMREGIGLANTRERLAKIYGASGRFALTSEPGRGTRVTIILPHCA